MGELAVKEGTVPLVRIDILEGRPPEVIEELHPRVASVVAEIAGTPLERVRTIDAWFPCVPQGDRFPAGTIHRENTGHQDTIAGRNAPVMFAG